MMMTNYWSGKKVLITGGNGFIGTHFIKTLNNLNATTINVSLHKIRRPIAHKNYYVNIENCHTFDNIDEKIDVIIHCAAIDGNSEFKEKNSVLIFDSNTKMVSNVLNYAKTNNISDVVLMSSAEIYTPNTKSPISENGNGSVNYSTQNGYILSKIVTEMYGEIYSKQCDMRVFTPRPTNTYGPGDNFGTNNNRVVPSFIKKIDNGVPLEIWGNCKKYFNFIYITDLVESILRMVETRKYRTLNIANEEPISLEKLALNIGLIFGKDVKVKIIHKPVLNSNGRILNIEKLKSILNTNLISMSDGLKKTIDWYKNYTRI
ncbi:MAG: NAD(P)-dependent oxidoreductase [Candidatus Roizmanbacteria bacterium]|nr:NAD(P)-dependent oxidoreductase [Candidatus Roizmanbacteria bacterium]